MIDDLRPIYKKLDDDQSLLFPCDNSYCLEPDSLGSYVSIDDSDGHDEAKKACIIQALHLYRNHDAINEAKQSALMGTKSESLGKVSRTMSGLNPLYSFDASALRALKEFVDLRLKTRR